MATNVLVYLIYQSCQSWQELLHAKVSGPSLCGKELCKTIVDGLKSFAESTEKNAESTEKCTEEKCENLKGPSEGPKYKLDTSSDKYMYNKSHHGEAA